MAGTGSEPFAFGHEALGHAAWVRWPRTLDDLTNTSRCPACQTDLRSPICSACGLDLRHPAAVELLAVSTDAAALLSRRITLIDHIRSDSARAFHEAAMLSAQQTTPA